jgi:arylsulfatase A-like enzyme
MPPGATVFPGMKETLTKSPATGNWDDSAKSKPISAIHFPPDYVDYRAGIINKKWENLSDLEKKSQERYMEIFAAMVSNLDYNVGLLIQHLKDVGEYDRTFIMFHSDNGPEGLPIARGEDPKAKDEANAAAGVYENLGRDTGTSKAINIEYGLRWAEVSATPFSQMKSWLGEGSTSVPAIVHLPGQTVALPALSVFTHVTDEAPTLLELAGVPQPSAPAPPRTDAGSSPSQTMVVYGGRNVYPMTGQSLLATLVGASSGPTRAAAQFGEEIYGRASIYGQAGRWKARWTEPPFGPQDGHWELFDLNSDRGETKDVSKQNPRVVDLLFQQWQTYMTRVGGVEPKRPQGYF